MNVLPSEVILFFDKFHSHSFTCDTACGQVLELFVYHTAFCKIDVWTVGTVNCSKPSRNRHD